MDSVLSPIKTIGFSLFILLCFVQCESDSSTQISFQACTQNCQLALQRNYPSNSVCLIVEYYNEDQQNSQNRSAQNYSASIQGKQIVVPQDIFKSDAYTHANISFFIHSQDVQSSGSCGKLNLYSGCDLGQDCIMKVNITQIQMSGDGTLSFATGFCKDEEQICNQ